ncbi:MAG TPA: hypothetical protein VLG12_03050 [Candidatus Saccharimonadales bacterium]|nr:hypothetical protein [Candidatus Saccharimonadales bacterium]
MENQVIDTKAYRQHALFKRNQEIWRYRFLEGWPLKKIAKHFDLDIQELKKIIATHKEFYKQEYS